MATRTRKTRATALKGTLAHYWAKHEHADWMDRLKAAHPDLMAAITAGNFVWGPWIDQENAAFPERQERMAMAQSAQKWLEETAVAEWAWMSACDVPIFLQRRLAQLIIHKEDGGPWTAIQKVSKNPYVLAQLTLDQVGMESWDRWWYWIDRLGQHQLRHHADRSTARVVGAIVLRMAYAMMNGHTQQTVRKPKRLVQSSWVYWVAKRLQEPGMNVQRLMDHVFDVLLRMAEGTLKMALPYVWESQALDLRVNHAKDTIFINWRSVYWTELEIRDALVERLSDRVPRLPTGWQHVLAEAGIPPLRGVYQAALASMWSRPLTIITGPAGSGKTTLIRALAVLRRHFAPDEPLWATATTGKAADRMRQVLGSWVSEAERPRTIHRLLAETHNWPEVHRGGLEALGDGWLVLDEASMADVWLLGRVGIGLPKQRGHWIIVGDPHQLAPVGPGAPLINAVQILDKMVQEGVLWDAFNPVYRLDTVFRTDDNALRANAVALLAETEEERETYGFVIAPWEAMHDAGLDEGVWYRVGATPTERLMHVMEWVAAQERAGRDWQIVTPRRADAAAINAAVRQHLVLRARLEPDQDTGDDGERIRWSVGDRVMQIQNDYELGLMNGQQGVIQAVDAEHETITAIFDETPVMVDSGYADTFWRWSWAVTVHKGQGSQWDAVAFVVNVTESDEVDEEENEETQALRDSKTKRDASPWTKMAEKKDVVYTALTRAVKQCVIIGPDDPVAWLEAVRRTKSEGQTRQTRLESLVRKTIMANKRRYERPPGGWVEVD